MNKIRKIVLIGGLFTWFSWFGQAFAQMDDASLRAGWIVALMQYTDWKDRNTNPIVICTIGRDSVGVALRQIQKEKSLPLAVVEKGSDDSFSNCHILYIAESDTEQAATILKNTHNRSLLTVSIIKGFAEMGGVVEFITNGKKVSLLINIPAAKKEHLVIKTDLLAIAKHID